MAADGNFICGTGKKMIFLADVGSVDGPVNDLVELGAAVYTGDGDLIFKGEVAGV